MNLCTEEDLDRILQGMDLDEIELGTSSFRQSDPSKELPGVVRFPDSDGRSRLHG